MPIYTYPLIYLMVIIVGVFNYKKYSQNKYLKYFLFFLIYSLLTEIIGAYFGRVLVVKNNSIYNTWNIVNFLFYSFFFLSKISNKRKRNFIRILQFIFIIFTIINVLFFSSFFTEVLISNSILGKSLVAITIIVYFSELLESDQILSIQKSLFFWIGLGAFLYNLGFIPAFALFNYTSIYGSLKFITLGLNIVMSSCFITGFIVSKKEYNI